MRLLVLALCLATLVFYGHAIGGLWGYFIGKPAMSSVLWGLFGGTLSGTTAVFLWHRYMVKNLYGKDPGDSGSDL